MAQSGDDVRLSRMLLDVALDLDAEADAIETGAATERRRFPRVRRRGVDKALLHVSGSPADPRFVQVVDLSAGGSKFRVEAAPAPGTKVTLELLGADLRLDGTILRVSGSEAAMVFAPSASADPELIRWLRSEIRPPAPHL